MATPDWEAIESAYRAGVLSLREIGAQYGVTEGQSGREPRSWNGYARKVRRYANPVRKSKARTTESPRRLELRKERRRKAEPPAETKPIRGSRTDPPSNPFKPGNQQALKHGGYARRLLLKDEVIEDARALQLEDELFRLRANNLTAAENIGRWITLMDDAESDEARDKLQALIVAADKAMMRNTVRIESIVGTLATVGKIFADTDYRKAATEKVSLEADRLRRDAGIDDGNGERDLNDFYSDIQTDAESDSA